MNIQKINPKSNLHYTELQLELLAFQACYSNSLYCSKLDENTTEGQLRFLLPQHEYFHQYFVLADCESQLFREKSRGLSGGSYLLATLLNRKDAKNRKGKEAVEALGDFYKLKTDTTFNNFFFFKYGIKSDIDNTPEWLMSKSSTDKANYLHRMVADALRDLMPYFADACLDYNVLPDFPLENGRIDSNDDQCLRPVHGVDESLSHCVNPQTQDQIVHAYTYMEKIDESASSTTKQFVCKICSKGFKFEAICTTHIEACMKNLQITSNEMLVTDMEDLREEDEDMYWNYKSSEFYVDSLFMIATVYEKFGDGLGMFIQSKMLLPILHGLREVVK